MNTNTYTDFKQAMIAAKAEKVEADKNYKLALLKYNFEQELMKVRILNPQTRLKVVEKLDFGKLIHKQISEHEFSAYAEGTDAELNLLKEMANKYFNHALDNNLI